MRVVNHSNIWSLGINMLSKQVATAHFFRGSSFGPQNNTTTLLSTDNSFIHTFKSWTKQSKYTMTFSVTASTRKARRKEERAAKKQNKRAKHSLKNNKGSGEDAPSGVAAAATTAAAAAAKKTEKLKSKPERSPGKKTKRTPPRDIYASLPTEVAAAMKRDDDEIAALEAKLGLGGSTSKDTKSRLNSEYAKKECFGENFGSFLDDLDNMVERILQPNAATTGDDSSDDDDDDDDDENTYKSGSTSESEKVEEHASTE